MTLNMQSRFGARASHDRAGLLFALAGVLLFSFKGIYIKFAYGYGVDAVTLLVLRMVFSLPVYLGLSVYFLWLYHQKSRQYLSAKSLGQTALCGFLGYYLASYMDLEALKFISVQLERLILFTYPTFVVLLSLVFLGERISGRTWIALGLSYLGILIVFGHDLKTGADVLTGSLLVLTSAFVFAVYMIFARPLVSRLGVGLFTSLAMLFSSLFVFIHAFASGGGKTLMQQPSAVYGWALVLALLGTVLPSFLVSKAISLIGSVRTSIAGSVGPIFTALFAVFLVGEVFTIYHLMGTLLVISGMVLLSRPAPRSPES